MVENGPNKVDIGFVGGAEVATVGNRVKVKSSVSEGLFVLL